MEINEYLIKCFQLMRSMENIDFFAGAHELSRTEFRLLREVILEEEKGKNIISSELARRLGITRSAVSQIVTKMEKDGVVTEANATMERIGFLALLRAQFLRNSARKPMQRWNALSKRSAKRR